MIINKKPDIRGSERRRKRLFIPIIYFLAEITLVWLALALVQLNFDMLIWNDWAIIIFIVATIYSIAKTINVYQRQKDYSKVNEEEDM